MCPFHFNSNVITKVSHLTKRARAAATLWVVAGLWLVAIVAVMIGIAVYSNTSGPAGRPPVVWPAQSQISHVAGRPTLVMFVHPRCPCSRASLEELARLLVRDFSLGGVSVVFLNPSSLATNWVRSDLWEQAAQIPGVTVQVDPDGGEAKRFGAETSGMTMLYSAAGRLQFAGGITLSRGHAGDNPGRSALADWLAHGVGELSQTPVFGCPLFAEQCAKGAIACRP